MQFSFQPFLLIISFFSINLPFSLCANVTAGYGNCSKPITCGSVESNLSYPFWGANRPDYCGKSGFKVTCQDDVPLITMRNINFRILDMTPVSNSSSMLINMSNNNTTTTPTVKVSREDYWGTICPSSYVPTNLNFSLFSYSSGLLNVSIYYGCNISMMADASNVLDCNNTGTASYLTQTKASNLTTVPVPYPYACENEVSVPVFESASEALDGNDTDIQTAIDGGFELDVVNDDGGLCNDCVASGGVCGQNSTSSQFICFCRYSSSPSTCSGNSSMPSPAPSSSDSRSHGRIIGIWLGVSGAFLIILGIIYISRKKMIFPKKEQSNELDIDAFIRNHGSIAPKRYSYQDVVKMTNSFEDQIGKGGYGTVYKGKLPDGLLVAVKVLNESKGDGEEFINEVASIGRTSHVNVVTLTGFCYQRNKRALIYEYMPNGSLDKFINNHGSLKSGCPLEWNTLYEIAVGVARGLEYLHRGCNTRILHFDIKPQNILLDKDFCPKIADFGLAKLCKTRESIVSMLGTRGTAGYIAPEVISRNFGGVSHKSDVYSYGMLVLEMVGARRNLHSNVSHTSEMFPHYVYKDLDLDNDDNIFRAIPEEENETVRKMMLISLGCIQTIPTDRPSMSKVVEMLEGSVHSLTVPPKPVLFTPTASTIISSDAEESTYVI
ncbi:LEAF RUST 10 DISEASE-RESISTANCE LOCUS RECEPTOR-LIKE PROTEIN KINASE-like 2.5 [Argentina anserina]|uniref:LEAF RUST 10 DISEASE-RESISTANCE LOCUS RECEPTOR-LIKE PROTEIN KINASE-like 2.5 n=1 Tax=Argentina anserina TaxID=57926 RepID=UPI00217630E6|nr:LEAF RUST 10 DISEASE-RESISTANCE LOCUS RECEPTOR-LIKE PROTEIN KINASE-like 2.5 [Potentilla anserina]